MKPIYVLILALLLSGINGTAQTIFLKSYGDENPNYFSEQVSDKEGNSFLAEHFTAVRWSLVISH
ncbi:MAG: hypothetical protein IPH42_17020 [Bacteroidetes bacterium]|nr:hypothetical protein [Bacteroidota bacterium]